MTFDFTSYLLSLGSAGEPRDGATYKAALKALRTHLVGALKQRGLWEAPPRFLGVSGGGRWNQELLDELVFDCYSEIFWRRFSALRNQLLVRPEVNGVIVRCIRNFLHDRQRLNDPLGYKVYEILRDSLRRLFTAGTLWIDGAHRDSVAEHRVAVHNASICAFTPGLRLPQGGVALEDRARVWNDALWPGLITAQGRARTEIRRLLDTSIAGLEDAGIRIFRFADLIEPMKRDVRARWSEELMSLAEAMITGRDFAAELDFQALSDCVLGKIEGEAAAEQEELRQLWLFLWTYAAGLNRSAAAAKAEKSGKPPSELGLSKELGIPRHRIAALKDKLGQLIGDCSSAVSRKGQVRSPQEVSSGGPRRISEPEEADGRDMNPSARQPALAQAIGKAAARWTVGRSELEGLDRPLREGDICVLPNDSDLLVEWTVAEVDAAGRLLLLAMDDGDLVGSRDLASGLRDGGGLPSVRCGISLWLDAAQVEPGWRTGTLPAETLERIRSHRQAITQGTVTASLRQRQIEEEPAYRWRLRELRRLRTQLESSLSSRAAPRAVPESPRAVRPVSGWIPLAAALLLTLGLGWLIGYRLALPGKVSTESHPNLPWIWLTAAEPVRGADHPLEVPADARRVVWILEVATTDSYPRYRVELSRADGVMVWRSDELVERGSELSFDLRRSLLATGRYDLRIYGLSAALPPGSEDPREDVAKPLQEYSVWIEIE